MTGFFTQNWGNVASVAGLGVSLWVLLVARKAKSPTDVGIHWRVELLHVPALSNS